MLAEVLIDTQLDRLAVRERADRFPGMMRHDVVWVLLDPAKLRQAPRG